jgi:hypothetical protein
MKALVTLFFFSFSTFIFGQEIRSLSIGARVGIAYSFGTHTNALGFCANAYIATNHIQFNLGGTIKYNFTGLGHRTDFTESLVNTGVVLFSGKKTNPIPFELGFLNHQSSSPYSLGYGYIWYFDGLETRQRSGSWKVEIERISLTFENDLFGGQGKDRFRTGALLLSYRDSLQSVSLGVQLWTGETKGGRVFSESTNEFPNGYKDLSTNYLGKTSHGIVFVGYTKKVALHVAPSFRLGVDSERVRHLFQNKISHNLCNIPFRRTHKSVYYPMLSNEGYPVLNHSQIRKSKPYFQYSLNEQTSYL